MQKLFKCGFCQSSFLYCDDEQQFFVLKSCEAEQRQKCDSCSVIKRNSKTARDNTVVVECQGCTSKTRVPFNSNGYNSVFCTSCLQKSKVALIA